MTREQAINLLDNLIGMVEDNQENDYDSALRTAIEALEQPEIIYCKDCKHKGTKNCVANAWTTIFGVTVKDDFFCGLGKRRTDDND